MSEAGCIGLAPSAHDEDNLSITFLDYLRQHPDYKALFSFYLTDELYKNGALTLGSYNVTEFAKNKSATDDDIAWLDMNNTNKNYYWNL